jgi:hypothetical protein
MDPFTEVLLAIWTLLESSTKFTDAVDEHNRIKLSMGSAKPRKTEFSTSDFPMVVVLPYGNINVNMSKSSSSASFVQRYRIVVYDGDNRPTEKFLPLKWIMFCLLSNMESDTFSLDYVKNVSFSDMSDDAGEDDIHPGWRSVFDIDVEMWFERAYMKSNI